MRERYVEMPLEVEGMNDKLKAGLLPPPCRHWPTLNVLSWVDILVGNVEIHLGSRGRGRSRRSWTCRYSFLVFTTRRVFGFLVGRGLQLEFMAYGLWLMV